MSPPSAATLLRAWECARAQPPLQQALTLLGVVAGDGDAEGLALLPLGERDRRLAALRAQLFGACLEASVSCPSCAALLELTLRVNDIWSAPGAELMSQIAIAHDAYALAARLPNSADIATAAAATQPQAALVARCLLEASHDGAPVNAASLPADVIAVLGERLAQADPQADVRIALECAECGQCWESQFDIAAYLWDELESWAPRMLREVHVLARAYGWSERDILGLSATRRRLYLELAGQ